MRQIIVSLFFISFCCFTCFVGCGGSKEAGSSDEYAMDEYSDTSGMASMPNSLKSTDSSEIATSIFGDLDSVEVTTDERINPAMLVKNGSLSSQGLSLDSIAEPGLGCRYHLPKTWTVSRKEFKNLVNYISGSGISITISVAKASFDSLNLWAQVEEAISFGKNQIPRSYQRFPASAEQGMNSSQTYIGRYEFGGKQYNTAFYRMGDYQFNIITNHPVENLAAEDAAALNYLFATFRAGEPKVEIPKPVATSSESPIETATKGTQE
jgi:hypothetical protein